MKIYNLLILTMIISPLMGCASSPGKSPRYAPAVAGMMAESDALVAENRRRSAEQATQREAELERNRLFDVEQAKMAQRRYEESKEETRLQVERSAAQHEIDIARIQKDIKNRPIWLGMTARQIVDKSHWGKPDSINRTITTGVVAEQWIYANQGYLYLRNGRLVAIQNRE